MFFLQICEIWIFGLPRVFPVHIWSLWLDPILFPYILPITQIALTGMCTVMFFRKCMYISNTKNIPQSVLFCFCISRECVYRCRCCTRKILQYLQTLQQKPCEYWHEIGWLIEAKLDGLLEWVSEKYRGNYNSIYICLYTSNPGIKKLNIFPIPPIFLRKIFLLYFFFNLWNKWQMILREAFGMVLVTFWRSSSSPSFSTWSSSLSSKQSSPDAPRFKHLHGYHIRSDFWPPFKKNHIALMKTWFMTNRHSPHCNELTFISAPLNQHRGWNFQELPIVDCFKLWGNGSDGQVSCLTRPFPI